jgi:hypothetical protein
VRAKQKPIKEPDQTNKTASYWAKVLSSHDLSMKRGHQPNVVTYIGGNKNIQIVEEKKSDKSTGKVKPEGHGSDH